MSVILSAQCLNDGADPGILGFQETLPHFVGSLHLNHAANFLYCINIRVFQKTLKYCSALYRLYIAIRPKASAAGVDECRRIDWAIQAELGKWCATR